jgi:hypothetical protein
LGHFSSLKRLKGAYNVLPRERAVMMKMGSGPSGADPVGICTTVFPLGGIATLALLKN